MTQEHNAKIESADIEVRGTFAIWSFTFDYGGCHQGWSGKVETEDLAEILHVVGVERWRDLTDAYVRVIREDGFNGRVLGIKNILKEKAFRG